MKRILIDTNIYSLAMRGSEDVIEVLRQTSHIGISAISIGELLSGFRSGNREQKNRQELNQFLVTYRKISCFFTRNFSDKALIPFIGVRFSQSIALSRQ